MVHIHEQAGFALPKNVIETATGTAKIFLILGRQDGEKWINPSCNLVLKFQHQKVDSSSSTCLHFFIFHIPSNLFLYFQFRVTEMLERTQHLCDPDLELMSKKAAFALDTSTMKFPVILYMCTYIILYFLCFTNRSWNDKKL